MLDKPMFMLYNIIVRRGLAQLGSALVLGTRGRRFESCNPDHVVGAGFACSDFLLPKN